QQPEPRKRGLFSTEIARPARSRRHSSVVSSCFSFLVLLDLCVSSPRQRNRGHFKAGEGNRTLVFSLEGYCSTIELHPPNDRGLSIAGHEPAICWPSTLDPKHSTFFFHW